MSSSKYTLDRIEDGYAVFLKYPNEEDQIILLQSAIHKPIKVGDRVMISQIGEKFHIEILKEETEKKKADIQNLMERLRQKNK